MTSKKLWTSQRKRVCGGILIQTLAGDQTDGYSGVPGVGVKRAIDLLEKDGYTWDTVVKAFKSKELDEDTALMNARLAKILQHTDYDAVERRVIPWLPHHRQ